MQAFSESDNRGWMYWAEFHGYNRYECWHHARIGLPSGPLQPYDLFLPWHRAYLMFFDHASRDQNEGAILPWWDWTSDLSHQSGLPQAYAAGPESLRSGVLPAMQGQPARRTRRNPSSPGGLPTKEQVFGDGTPQNQGILGLNSFIDFSNALQDIHDGIHGWVGGDMGSIGTSAFDPVFWAHHAMIDRLWYLWQLRHGVNNIPNDYLDLALFPGYRVRDVLDTRSLGYEYANAAVVAGDEVPPGVGVTDAGEASGDPDAANGGGGDSGPGEEVPDEPIPPITGKKYESGSVPIGALDSEFYRADIEFHGVDHAGASYEGRVYVNNPEADENTGDSPDSGYAGSYYVFGHGGCLGDPGHCEVKERRAYDPRPSHPLSKARKSVRATEAIRYAVQQGAECRITVVPIVEPLPYEDVDPKYEQEPVEIDYVKVVTYR
jgi:tyrosinase